MQSVKLKKNFRYLPDIATADLAFEAFGATPSELFNHAALALEDSMVKLDNIKASTSHTIIKEENNLENLLYSFLEELVFLKDAEQLIFSKMVCKVEKVDGGKWMVESGLAGEKIDSNKHKLGVDVKAVTKHLFKVEKLPNKTFRCQVILDV